MEFIISNASFGEKSLEKKTFNDDYVDVMPLNWDRRNIKYRDLFWLYYLVVARVL